MMFIVNARLLSCFLWVHIFIFHINYWDAMLLTETSYLLHPLCNFFYFFFRMSKNSGKKSGCTLQHDVLAQKKVGWKNFFCDLYKKEKKLMPIYMFRCVRICLFWTDCKKNFFLHVTFCVNMKCHEQHAKILFRIFWHFEKCFLGSGCICMHYPHWISAFFIG